MDNLKLMLVAIVVLLFPSVSCGGDTDEGDLVSGCSLLENEIFIISNGEVWYNVNQPIFGFQIDGFSKYMVFEQR